MKALLAVTALAATAVLGCAERVAVWSASAPTLDASRATAVGAGALSFGAIGAVAGDDDASDWKATYGVSDDFVKQVGGTVPPGASALFAVIRSMDPVAVAEKFRGYGGTVLRTTLSPAQADKVKEIIATRQQATH